MPTAKNPHLYVLRRRHPWAELDLYVAKAALEIVPVRVEHAAIACDAYHLYGKGRHLAGLNFGDVLAYALVKATLAG